MTALSRRDVLEALASGRFETMLDVDEGPQLDFKERAYDLEGPKGLRDLVADVASFANSRGGVIVLGARTTRDPTTRREFVAAFPGVASESVDDERYRALVRAHVFPLVRDLRIDRYPGSDAEGRETLLIAIDVDAQDEQDQPFIVDRIACRDEDGADPPHAIGWPTRAGQDTHWERAARMQQLLGAGRRAAVTPDAQSTGALERLTAADEDLQLIENEPDWQPWPYYVVQFVPSADEPVRDYFDDFRNEAENWRGLRPNGFHLPVHWGRLEVAGRRLLRIAPGRAVIVHLSGLLTAAGSISPDFLGWGQHRMGAGAEDINYVTINPWVLVEYTLEALRFAYELMAPRAGGRDGSIRAFGCHLQGRKPTRLRIDTGMGPAFDTFEATQDEVLIQVRATGDVYRDTFQILAGIFGEGFGLGQSQVPFSHERRVDPALFVKE